MAGIAAADNGNEVHLFEKNEKLGKKIYITGKGRCNFTNDTSAEDFISHIVRGDKFLRGAIYSFPPQKTMDLMQELREQKKEKEKELKRQALIEKGKSDSINEIEKL